MGKMTCQPAFVGPTCPFQAVKHSPRLHSPTSPPSRYRLQPQRLRLAVTASAANVARSAAVSAGAASTFPPELKALVQKQIANPIFYAESPAVPRSTADAQRSMPPRFLTDEECSEAGTGGAASKALRDSVNEIIRVARDAIFAEAPSIGDEGGALWPAFRAEACWRDLENFVRVVSYGCVCENVSTDEWLSPVGFDVMDQIYSGLEVPRREMRIGLEAGGAFAVDKLLDGIDFDDAERAACRRAFAALVAKLVAMPGGSAT